ncbi:MAG: DEAD/DEAH box helicase [Bacteroides sp.]
MQTPFSTYTVHSALNEIRSLSLSEKEKGTQFEHLMQRWFKSDPRYSQLTQVWLWDTFPGKKEMGGTDLGIDLVAKTDLGDYWAIQCKCYAEDHQIDKGDINSFVANASRKFLNEDLQTRTFSNLILVNSTRKPFGPNAEKATQNLTVPFTRINLYELEASTVDWRELMHGKEGRQALQVGKQPRAHQLKAMSCAYRHYVEEGKERGRMIMACGTGKTYTSLKIMEQLTGPESLTLFLVPSIALLGQTLNAWMSDTIDPIRAICVCSDGRVSRRVATDDDDLDEQGVRDLAVPATTDVRSIVRQLRAARREHQRTVIFSTYQSIDSVSDALLAEQLTADLCICDEAHRTTGVNISGRDESNFTKVHRNELIPAHRRLYMTATPRLYAESVRVRAAENDHLLCSMDDVSLYGEEFYRLSFNEAVQSNLLTDYKVLVLTVNEEDLPHAVVNNIKAGYTHAHPSDKLMELNFDDATKLIGCINGLSKRIHGDDGATRQEDPVKMKRAVAFCQTIRPTQSNPNASSTQMARYFESVCQEYKQSLPPEQQKEVVNVKAQHIDGSMDATTRNELISWLKAEADAPDECRVLCNVRCLSEGVDVPALDAVLFMSPRNSEVEVVQSVGRVMRSFGRGTEHEKKFGYIIIPIIVPSDVRPEDALADNERFRVVWTILNALRSHDDEFNAKVNQINLNRQKSTKVVVGGVPRDQYSIGNDGPTRLSNEEVAQQLELRFGALQRGIYARLVEEVGDRLYWAKWGNKIGQVATKFIERIGRLIKENEQARHDFADFVGGLQKNINPSVDESQAIEMLAQHMITRPVFDALFKEYRFVQNNAVSRSMETMIATLVAEGFEMDIEVLERFYNSVRINVGDIDNLEGKQTIIKNLYEQFFKGAFPKTVEKLGIVYTPVECVDFILHSVDAILRRQFDTSLTEENVHILDPFTGTGTFMTRLLQSGLIRRADMMRKYRNEIHCNEIVLLAYYIADVNIESVYHDLMKPDEYLPYDGICLTDTFQLNEHGDKDIFSQLLPENSDRVIKQKKAPVRVIIGNPPYSVGQRSANDNAQNLSYPQLDGRIASTYAAHTQATNKNSLYDSYIKAFRWASDRIAQCPEGGIVAFISNGAWIDGNAQDGMRRCLRNEFTSVYVLNLRGNARTSGELRRKEGDGIFGVGSRTPIAITFLVKKPHAPQASAQIHYHDIGDYLTREQKLSTLKEFRSIEYVNWQIIEPNAKQDWINQRRGGFDEMIALGDKNNKFSRNTFFVPNYSNGLKTQRDNWCYNFSKKELYLNIDNSIKYYNNLLDNDISLEDIEFDSTHFAWTTNCVNNYNKHQYLKVEEGIILESIYRPFCKQKAYYHKGLNERRYQLPKLFPTPNIENLLICVSGVGVTKEFSCIITNILPDLELIGKSQCFPLYWYEENPEPMLTLFDTQGENGKYKRRDGITDWIKDEVRKRYHTKEINKEQIFYYVYGLLHSDDYRTRFSADLKKSLPRIPLVEDVDTFLAFSKAGKKLAKLHLNYEQVKPHPDVVVEGDRKVSDPATEDDYQYFTIPDRMRFASRNDKSTIVYNGHIRVTNIPAKAYDYVVNGKSAIEWIVERYCVKTDRKSLIKNDCNDWAREHQQPRYILDLLLSVIHVSVQTVDIVQALPRLNFD